MAFTEFDQAMAEVAMEAFVARKRPPVELRDKVDLAFRIEDQSVVIFELRPSFRDRKIIVEEMVAKTTFVRTAKRWRIYWQRADMKRHRYGAAGEVRSLEEFLAVVEADAHGCFWG